MNQAGAPARYARRTRIRRAVASVAGAGLLLALAGPAGAQGTTVIGDDGGQNDVVVNMDALDGGGAPSWGRGSSRGGGSPSDRDATGELVEGPNGVLLRMPPPRPPRSRLTVDPGSLAETAADGASAPQLTAPGTGGRDRQARTAETGTRERTGSRDRTAAPTAAAPPKPASPPQQRAQWTRAAEAERMTAAETRPAGTDPASTGPASTDPADTAPSDTAAAGADPAGTSQPADTGQRRADTGTREQVRTQTASAPQRRPERKPAPPQPTGSENAGTASRTEDAGTASRTEDAGTASRTEDAGTASGTEDSGTASGTNAGGQQTQAAGGGAPDLPDPPSFDDTAQGETGTRTAEAASDAAAAGGEAANGEANGGEANGGEAASGGTGSTTGTATGTTQTARLPEGALPDQLRLDFGRGASELTPAIESTLSRLAEELKAQPEQRIQLKAFAAAEGGNASQARRLSLSRALAVRSFLIDQGIRSTRMDVRALGNTADSGPLDRVDIVPATR